MKVLIVSGPTREPLDPVRYLSNYSTGTMGKALVAVARQRHHKVRWVRCPEDAETARDLERCLTKEIKNCDALFMAAAVCDASPAVFSKSKIKKDKLRSIRLVKNPDILAGLPKTKGQVFVGFGLESENILENGFKKLVQKKLDLIVLQKVSQKKNPFGEKPIEAFILDKQKNSPPHAAWGGVRGGV